MLSTRWFKRWLQAIFGVVMALAGMVAPAESPSIARLTPETAFAGGGDFTLTVQGSNFTSASMVLWGGAALKTEYKSETELTAVIPADWITLPGSNPRYRPHGWSGCPERGVYGHSTASANRRIKRHATRGQRHNPRDSQCPGHCAHSPSVRTLDSDFGYGFGRAFNPGFDPCFDLDFGHNFTLGFGPDSNPGSSPDFYSGIGPSFNPAFNTIFNHGFCLAFKRHRRRSVKFKPCPNESTIERERKSCIQYCQIDHHRFIVTQLFIHRQFSADVLHTESQLGICRLRYTSR